MHRHGRTRSRLVAGALATGLACAASVLVTPVAHAADASVPISCTVATGYIVSAPTGSGPSTLSTASVRNGRFSADPGGVTLPFQVNGIGFNPNDGFIYGTQTAIAGNANQFVRIDKLGNTTLLGVPDDGSVDRTYDAGVVTTDDSGASIWVGFLRTGGNRSLTKIPIPALGVPAIGAVTTVALTGFPLAEQPRDVAFDPTDGLMYTMQADGYVYSISLAGVVTRVTTSPTPVVAFAGGAWSDSFGNLFFYQNGIPVRGGTSQVYELKQDLTIESVGEATNYGLFDATSCLPIALEKTSAPQTVRPGQSLTFTFRLANPYSLQYTLPSVTDTLPAGTGLVWQSVSPASPAGGRVAISGSTFTISDLRLPPVTSGPITFTATTAPLTDAPAPSTAPPIAGAYLNSAVVQAANGTTIVSDDPSRSGGSDSTPFAVVIDRPSATDDTDTTPQGVARTTAVLANDTAGSYPLDPAATVFPTGGQPSGAVRSADGRSLTVGGEGRYAIDPATGAVTFTPEPAFTGTAQPVTYQVTDTRGQVATATLTDTVTPTPAAPAAQPPTATDDTATTPADTPVTVDVLRNDTAGSTPLDPTTVVLPATGQPAGSVRGADGRTLTVPQQGAYTVNPVTGTVTFTPATGFAGPTSPVGYQVSDRDGTAASARITVVVAAGPPVPAPATLSGAAAPGASPGGRLPATGSDTVVPAALGSLLLVVLGGVLMWATRTARTRTGRRDLG